MPTPSLMAAVRRVNATFDSLNSALVGRSAIVNQLKMAVLSGNHLLLEGPPGVAKTYMIRMFFAALTDCRTFMVQCTKKMSEDYLVGPLDMRKFREEGVYEHRTEGSIVDAHYAYVDEFLDLSPNTLRALLEILNERTFTRGLQRVKSPLHSCIGSTNFSGENKEELTAVMDRFLFKAKVTKLVRPDDRRQMIVKAQNPPTIIPLSHRDVKMIWTAARKLKLSGLTLETFLLLSEKLELTDRFLVKAIDVLRVHAVMRGAPSIGLNDLQALESCFVTTNDPGQSQRFSHAMTHVATANAKLVNITACTTLSIRAYQLEGFAQAADSYDAIKAVAIEIRELHQAIRHFSVPEAAETVKRVEARCHKILQRAGDLYRAENAAKV